jgi:hypothetical protein
VIVVVNLDPHGAREATVHLDMPALGLDWDSRFTVDDQVTGQSFEWGAHDYVRLDPFSEPAHVLTVRRSGVSRPEYEHGELVSLEQSRDPLWFKRAVFYEVLIRGFRDSNGDGTGDIRGLTEKLDYLQWLGVDCVWLLPIYESPLRDGGYDISDFMKVLPEFGDLGDFVQLVDEAHKRGMRIIADLVMNHSSDQHPWFQASRSDPRARTATTTCGPTPTSRTPRRGSSSSTPRSPTGPGTRCASSSTGTASSATSRTSTTRTPPSRAR